LAAQQAEITQAAESCGMAVDDHVLPVDEEQLSSIKGGTEMTQDDAEAEIVENLTRRKALVSPANDIQSSLERFTKIKDFSFLANANTGDLLTSVSLPGDILNLPFIKARTSYYRYLKCDMEVKLLTNATKFDVGSMYMGIDPVGSTDFGMNKYQKLSLQSITGYQGAMVQVAPNKEQILRIPYRHWYKAIDLAKPQEIALVTLHCINPLLGNTSISCSVFARLVAPDLQVPYHLASAGIGMEDKLYSKFNTAKSIAQSVVNVSRSVAGLPVVGPIASTISTIGSWFGLAKPTNISPPETLSQIPTATWLLARARDNGIICGFDQEHNAGYTNQLGFTEEDEMSIEYLCAQKCLQSVHNWFPDAVDFPGKVLASVKVSPRNAQAITSDDLTYKDVDFIGALGERFELWRGPMEYEIEVISAFAQSGRLRVGIFPGDVNPSSVTLEDMDNVPNHIIDLNSEENHYKLGIPYLANTPWMRTYDVNATIIVMVLNGLAFQQGTPSQAYFNIWRRGSPDLRFTLLAREQYIPQWRDAKPISTVAEFQMRDTDTVTTPYTFEDGQEDLAAIDECKNLRDLIHRCTPVRAVKDGVLSFRTHTSMVGPKEDTIEDGKPVSDVAMFSRFYRFNRGGRVMKVMSQDGTFAQAITQNKATSTNAYYTPESVATSFVQTSRFGSLWPINLNPIVELIVPWFSSIPMQANTYNNFASAPASCIDFYTDATSGIILEAGADDFAFSYLIGPPRYMNVRKNT
jgi:hypothetical protein